MSYCMQMSNSAIATKDLTQISSDVARICSVSFVFFFFQAEDGIRDVAVTGVQTCALPISPLAAVLFSLEEVVGDLHAPVLGSVVLASATSWAMLRWLLGNNPLFHVPQYQLVNSAEFGIYAMLGVAGGVGLGAVAEVLFGEGGRVF